MLQAAHALMQRGIEDNVFPGAALLVIRGGEPVLVTAYGICDLFSRRPVTEETFFDLASLTKPLATTLAVMYLVEQGRLHLNRRLDSLLPEFGGAPGGKIRVEQLLDHTSGLAAYYPYYNEISLSLPAQQRREVLRRRLVAEAPMSDMAGSTVYSDLGFMILCWVVERLTGQRLDRFVARNVYLPLGIENLFFIDTGSAQGKKPGDYAATEVCPWRKILVQGCVHDENAYAAGGIEGHAGLFGDIRSVGLLLSRLMEDYYGESACPLFSQTVLHLFFTPRRPDARALGFDCPTQGQSSSGRYFSDRTIGHLGFTGTSFWVDLQRRIAVVLLTNRIHPSRKNKHIRRFRPLLHDAVMKTLI